MADSNSGHHHEHDDSENNTPWQTPSRISRQSQYVPSPVKIDLDYDVQHNLNKLHEDGTDQDGFDLNPTTLNVPTSAKSSLLSPESATFSGQSTPASQYGSWTPKSAGLEPAFLSTDPSENGTPNPFNFTPQQYVAANRAVGLARSSQENLPGKRKGHKYRHSSIHTAHQIFQPPTQRAPLAVPVSLPVPTRKEAWRSVTRNQNARLMWCLVHFLVAGLTQFAASGSLAITALSRLLFFDAAGATSCAAVEIMSNFEVWNRSTIRHPFGLGRADVLAGFGMAVFISFMGLDVISHGTQHALENLGNHEAHSSHSHERPSPVAVLLTSLAAAGATLISALVLKNHLRIGRAMQVPWLVRWGTVLGNASHFLTLSCCVALLILPLLNDSTYKVADPLMAFIIAGTMIAFGVRLGTRLGNILLMAYSHPSNKYAVQSLIAEIEQDSSVSAVESASIWQVHYGLGLADLKIRYRAAGYADDVTKIRQRIVSLIRSRLSNASGDNKGLRWDISIQVALEKD